jgi:electron transport complex protein RnfD
MTALGAAFAIIVAKEFFGGLGANVFNPALVGRAFLIMSFPATLTTWNLPRAFFGATAGAAAGVVTSATPLVLVKLGNTIPAAAADLAAAGVIGGGDYWSIIGGFFLGFRQGCIGESSILLILIGFVFLLLTGTIDWRAPVSMVLSVFVFSFLFGRDPLFAVVTGGVVFGAVFMTTDYVTAPLTAAGKLIFGAGAGLVTVLIRQWGNYPEGVTYGILIMNAVTPFLNRLLQKKYGYVKPQKTAAPQDTAKGGAK